MKPVHRIADTKMPGSFSIRGIQYVQISIGSDFPTGKHVVYVGDMKSQGFFTKDQAVREFDRISSESVITMEMLDGYRL